MDQINQNFANFRTCADDAPDGAYEDCKRLRDFIGEIADTIMQRGRAEFRIPTTGTDAMHNVEAVIYAYLKGCDPNWSRYAVAEAFGEHMGSDRRDLVMANTLRGMADFNRIHAKAEGR